MKLRVLAGALALGVGASFLAPMTASADDRRGDRARSYRSYRPDRSYGYSRPYRSSYYRNYSYRPAYRGYGYGYNNSHYYGGYGYRGYYAPYAAPYAYRPPVVVVPAYGYRAYRPLLGVSVAGPHFGVWLGF